MTGSLIVIEGLDYTGKSSTVTELKKLLDSNNYIFTREPGGQKVELAENIRNIIFNNKMDAITEAYLFAASRAAHTNKIQEWLNEGKTVICDRYLYSSLYYQGILKNIGTDVVMNINKYALRDVIPNTIFYLSISQQERDRRASLRNEINRLDEEIKKVSHDEANNKYLNSILNFTNIDQHTNTEVIVIDTSNMEPIEIAKKIINKINNR